MDLNDLKNLNMDDVKAKILAFADKKTLIKIGISVGSIIVFLIILYMNDFFSICPLISSVILCFRD